MAHTLLLAVTDKLVTVLLESINHMGLTAHIDHLFKVMSI